MGLYDFTFYDLIDRNARCFNTRPAWLEADDGRALTFGQFKETVDRLATGLQQHGIQKGDRIGVVGKNTDMVSLPESCSRESTSPLGSVARKTIDQMPRRGYSIRPTSRND